MMAVPSGNVAEPGKDVFAKDNRESRDSAWIEAGQDVVSWDAEQVVNVVYGEASGKLVVEEQAIEEEEEEEESAVTTVDEAAGMEKRPMDHELVLACSMVRHSCLYIHA